MQHPHADVALLEPLETRIAPATLFGIRAGNELFTFGSESPGIPTSQGVISGLDADETIEAIDFRPKTGELYALATSPDGGARSGQIYRLDRVGGGTQAVAIGGEFGGLATTSYGFDFNPTVDVIRVVDGAGRNLRIAPGDGTVLGTDTLLSDTGIEAVAYDRNTFDGGKTTLFGLDSTGNRLVRIGSVDGAPDSPGTGLVTEIGPLGVTLAGEISFDIEPRTGMGYFTTAVAGGSSLYAVNLTTGAATLIGQAGSSGSPDNVVSALAVAPPDDLTISADKKTATYIDIDGDLVTLKSPTGNFQQRDFTFTIGAKGSRLDVLDISLAARATSFEKASLTLTATPRAGLGDSFANVGFINATGIDLGTVSINGDLTKIIAGNAITDKTSPGLVSLTVQSMGIFDNNGPQSIITGPVGKLTIKTDSDGATFRVQSGGLGVLTVGGDLRGGGGQFDGLIETSGDIGSVSIRGSIIGTGDDQNGAIEAGGNIGKVFVGGSMRSFNPSLLDASITAVGNIGPITVIGDMAGIITAGANIASLAVGGSVRGTGFVSAGGTLGKVTITGSLLGGSGAESGRIESVGTMGAVKIGGDIRGGAGMNSGSLHSDTNLGAITLGGSLIGGTSTGAGTIGAFGPSGLATIGAVKIGGDIQGGSATSTGEIAAHHFITSVTVGGSVRGGTASESGTLFVTPPMGTTARGIGPVKIAGDLTGGQAVGSGTIATFGGNIASVTVGGSFSGGTGMGITAAGLLGPVKIGGDINSSGDLLIQARGVPGVPLAIASVTVGGDVGGDAGGVAIRAGYDYDLGGQNADVQIGPVTVGGNWLSGSIAAGALANNGIFGDADDTLIPGGNPATVSAIASITIKGYITSGFSASGFVAEQIGKLKIGAATIPLNPGASTDLAPLLLGVGGVFRVREV